MGLHKRSYKAWREALVEFLTCRNIGFIFGCFGFSLARLGCFWVGIAECGSCWAVGVIMVFRWCLRHVWALHLRSVSGFVVLWVVGVLCLGSAGRIGGMSVVIWWRLGGMSVMSWCNPGGVSVFIAWVGMYVRHVVFANYFIGVAVAF